MNAANEKRFAIARRTAALHAARPEVRAIALTGSVATNEADETSDIDMIVYCDTLPTEEDVNVVRETVGGSERILYLGEPEEGSFVEAYAIDGVKHDFAYTTLANWEQDMAVVLEQHVVDSPLQKALSGILDAVPLHGAEHIAGWKARAARYPDELADAMIRAHLSFYPPWVSNRMALGRGDLLWLYEILTDATRNILGVLLGLNRIYHWGEYKRMDAFLAKMEIAPPDLSARIKRMLRDEPHYAVRQLDALIEETFDLVEKHCPHIDVTPGRTRYRRPHGT